MPRVKHFGLVQFKEETTQEQIDHCFTELQGLVGQIDGLLDMNHGPYASEEGFNDGYTHGFIMTFESPEARDAYLVNPIHERVKNLILARIDRVVVFDFNLE